MKSSIKITGTVLLFLTFVSVKAQPLDNLVQEAFDNNLELKILKNDYRAALEKAPQASGLPDLEAGLGYFPAPVETRLGAQVFRLSLTQMFPWFGTIDQKRALENSKAHVLFERVAVRSLELAFEVKKSYLRLYEIEKSQAIIQRKFSIFESMERLALNRVESGKGNLTDVLNIRLQLRELQQEVEILEAAKAEPLAEINRLLNRPAEANISVVEELEFAQLLFEKDSLLATIRENHPLLRMFELQQEVSQKAIELNKLNGKPDFGAGVDYIFVNPRTEAEPSGNGRDIFQVKAMVTIPLYRKKYEAKEREERLIIESINLRKADQLNLFISEIEKAYASHHNARLKFELYEQQIELSRSIIAILESQYAATGDNFDELLRLEKELIDYDLKKLRAAVQSQLAQFSIEKLLLR